MRVTAFRIQNYRSIVDTGFQNLSQDNINVLIGQNESGKSAILEALAAFETNAITEDDLRTDESSPAVTCVFEIDDSDIAAILAEGYTMTDGVRHTIKELQYRVAVRKSWNAEDLSSPLMELENEQLCAAFGQTKGTTAADLPSSTDDDDEAASGESPGEGEHEIEQLTPNSLARGVFNFGPYITLFKEDSLLPATIDLADLSDRKRSVEGYIGAANFLALTGLTPELLADHQKRARPVSDRVDAANERISQEFRAFWSQTLGAQDKISIQVEVKNYDSSVPLKVGKPYLTFWIRDNNGKQKPLQRSRGVRWFISFFLTLKATAKKERDRLLLIDEPGANLHARAQEDILQILESEKERLQIAYATHSPYLLNFDKVYRILAVQRKQVDQKTETEVLPAHKLGSASNDTMFPLYTNMGIDLSHQQVIAKTENVILEEPSAHFYMRAFWKLLRMTHNVHFLPATGCNKVPALANLLLGWGIEFSVLLDDDKAGRTVYNQLKKNRVVAESRLIKIRECDGVEDLFTHLDFASIVLQSPKQRLSDDRKVSAHVKARKLSKPTLAADFLIRVESGEVTEKDLSPESLARIRSLLDKLIASL